MFRRTVELQQRRCYKPGSRISLGFNVTHLQALCEQSQPPHEVTTCLGQLQVDSGEREVDIIKEAASASIIERISPGLGGHSLMGPAYEFGGARGWGSEMIWRV